MRRWIWRRKWRLSVAAIALFVAGWLIWTEMLRAELEGKLQAMRDAGHPTVPADFAEAPVPDDENAAFLYSAAAEMLGEFPDALADPDDEFLEPEELEEADRWLESKAQVAAMLHQAANRKKCVFDIDWKLGLEMEIEFIPQSEKFANFLDALGKKKAREGNAEAALRCVDTIFRMAQHMPAKCFICYLVRVTLTGRALHTLRQIALEDSFDPAAARSRFVPFFAAATDRGPAVEAVRADLALCLIHSRRWIAGESPMHMLVMFGGEDAATWRDDTSWSRAIVDWAFGSWIMRPIAIGDALLLVDEFNAAATRFATADLATFDRDEPDADRGFPYIYSSAADMNIGMWGEQILALHAHIAITRAGLDALIHKKKHGSLPDNVDTLDPYTEQPLQYERREDGTARIEAARPIEDGWNREELEIVWELAPAR